MKVFAGIEGGASTSKLSLISEDGHVLYEDCSGPSTNHWLIGIDECVQRIQIMLTKVQEYYPFESLCVCLSGCEDHVTNEEIRSKLETEVGPNVSNCFVASDTLAPLFACNHSKGIVLIAGTGSNCLLFQESGALTGCGGWGHVLGDQGSAFWVSQKAIKAVIQEEDNYEKKNAQKVKELVFSHFSLSKLSDILEKVYRKFDKSSLASLCLPLAQLAEEGDPLARDIFSRAGKHLGRHVIAVLEKSSKEEEEEEGVAVVCVGSVFKSWTLLSKGFVSVFDSSFESRDFIVKRLKSSSAIGAALIGAKKTGFELQFKEDKSELLAHFKRGQWV